MSASIDVWFAPFMGLVFVFAKLVIKAISKRLALQQFDGREAFAFFGVDLSVLSLSVWIALGVHKRLGLNDKETVVVYVILVMFVFLTACIYKRHLKLAAVGKSGNLWAWINTVGGLLL